MIYLKRIQQTVYRIFNSINGKFYIGSSITTRNRWNSHKHALSRNIHGNPHLQKAYNKYGKDNFVYEILEELQIGDMPNILEGIYAKEYLENREQYYIDSTGCLDNKIGYNVNPTVQGSRNGIIASAETKLKMSIAAKIRHKEYPMTDETKKKIGEANRINMTGKKMSIQHLRSCSLAKLGHMVSEETRNKISKANKGKKLGVKASNNTRRKMSNTHKEIWRLRKERVSQFYT